MQLGAVSGLDKNECVLWLVCVLFVDISHEDFVDTSSEGLLHISSLLCN